MKNILAIGAHPDDIEFGCGGTILNHKSKGHFVVYVCMTSTESVDGTTGEIITFKRTNLRETINAAKILLCDEIEFFPFKDLHVPFSFESVSALEKIIKMYDIDTIYTHWAGRC
jgi:N-acetylglucosamine malate deacetylase 1